ncbi:MAG: hypothetical protein ABIU86_11290 [Gemmatimonadaceae bacterium]
MLRVRWITKTATFLALAACADLPSTAPGFDPSTIKASADLLRVTDPCTSERFPPASEVVFPSAQYRTLQSAVCAVTDNGTIHVLAGTHEVRITIWGKHINIRGAGSEEEPANWPVLRAAVPSEVVAANTADGVINLGGGGSLSLTMLRVVGGDAGILVDATSGPVDVRHARFEENGRGILHVSLAALSIKHTAFSGQLWNAISYAPIDLTAKNCGGLHVSHGAFGSTGSAGIFVRGCIHTIDHATITLAQGGGIVAIASVVKIDQVHVAFARYFGILLINTFAQIDNSSIDFTQAGPLPPNPSPHFGDAISVWTTDSPWAEGGPRPSVALLKNNVTHLTERAALSVFGGSVSLKGNLFFRQTFDFQSETFDGYVATLTDQGGNACLPSIGLGDPCVVTSSQGLTPPPPIGGA